MEPNAVFFNTIQICFGAFCAAGAFCCDKNHNKQAKKNFSNNTGLCLAGSWRWCGHPGAALQGMAAWSTRSWKSFFTNEDVWCNYSGCTRKGCWRWGIKLFVVEGFPELGVFENSAITSAALGTYVDENVFVLAVDDRHKHDRKCAETWRTILNIRICGKDKPLQCLRTL